MSVYSPSIQLILHNPSTTYLLEKSNVWLQVNKPVVLLHCKAFYTFPRLPPIKAHPTEGFWHEGEKPILALINVNKEDMMGSLSFRDSGFLAL